MCSFALVFAILATPIILASPAASRSIDVGSGFSGLEPITPGKNMLERSGVIWPYASASQSDPAGYSRSISTMHRIRSPY